jgi:2-(1,2-epoxy-1,2-dihydrophenyl)acetyl-CoA isomerase
LDNQPKTAAAFKYLIVSISDDVGTIAINRPEVMNALSPVVVHEIVAAIEYLTAEKMRCLVLTGAGRAFCAGANLSDGGSTDVGEDTGESVLERVFHPLFRKLRDLPVPVIAAVNGAAAGAGMSLALIADLIVCGRSAYFMQAFRRIGLVPDCGSSWTLPRLVGRARALELALLGDRLPAETALSWGLVNRVVDDAALEAETAALARNLASGPTLALGMIRRMIMESFEHSFEEQIALENTSQIAAIATADHKEGVQAFLEKRTAQFKGE